MTACERLKMAEERIGRGQWKKFGLSSGFGLQANYCLVGALCTEKELENVGWIGNQRLDVYNAQLEIFRTETDILPKEIVSVPGLQEAYEALGFRNGHDAYMWNDSDSTMLGDVYDRVSTARQKICPNQETPDGNPESAGA